MGKLLWIETRTKLFSSPCIETVVNAKKKSPFHWNCSLGFAGHCWNRCRKWMPCDFDALYFRAREEKVRHEGSRRLYSRRHVETFSFFILGLQEWREWPNPAWFLHHCISSFDQSFEPNASTWLLSAVINSLHLSSNADIRISIETCFESSTISFLNEAFVNVLNVDMEDRIHGRPKRYVYLKLYVNECVGVAETFKKTNTLKICFNC